jgi:hypothetical protein
VLESDYRTVDYAHIGKFHVYLFDGPHAERDHYDAIELALPALDEEFALIVDDWDWTQVREGTFRALEACGLQIDAAIDIRTTLDGSTPRLGGERSDWHNGYFLAAVSGNRQGAARGSLGGPTAIDRLSPKTIPEPVAPPYVNFVSKTAPSVLLAILAKQKEPMLPVYLACIEALD